MKNEFWLSLGTKNVEKAQKFYADMGFEMNVERCTPQMTSMFVGKQHIVLNLFPDTLISEFMGGQNVTDTKASNEIIFSIGADSPEEVNQWIAKAEKAGATIFAKPGYKEGWLYGAGFLDPDGHRWSLLYMDFSKMPNRS